jgi:hypothetical protein
MVRLVLALSCRHDECFDPDVEDWCGAAEASEEPAADGTCSEPAGEPSWRCGDYDALQIGDGITGEVHYFDRATGEHVATEYWSDVRAFCGHASAAWYGERIDCDPTCTYGDKRADLPPCDSATK